MTDSAVVPQRSFLALTGLEVPVTIVDVGANFLDEAPPYSPVLAAGSARVVGFEPNPEALARLHARQGPHETYLPHAVGDGGRHTLRLCRAEGMTSLLAPNPAVLSLFHGFPEWAEVREERVVETVRLDDIPETEGLDALHMDIQGAELMALRHAEKRLAQAVLLHVEVEFLPMYKGQALYADVDLFLRDRGFVLHRFSPLVSRVLRPLVVNNDIYAGMSQLLWADAVFVRDFTRPEWMSDRQLLALARLTHEVYGSYDLVLSLLGVLDRRWGTGHGGQYLAALTSG